MSNAPLDLAPWVARIAPATVAGEPAFAQVGLAGDAVSVQERPGSLPGAWVLPATDDATAPASEPLIHQRVRSRVSVLIGLRAYGETVRREAHDLLTPLRAALWAQLIGWTPPGAAASVHYAGGRRLAPANNVMWWEDLFETAVSVRK